MLWKISGWKFLKFLILAFSSWKAFVLKCVPTSRSRFSWVQKPCSNSLTFLAFLSSASWFSLFTSVCLSCWAESLCLMSSFPYLPFHFSTYDLIALLSQFLVFLSRDARPYTSLWWCVRLSVNHMFFGRGHTTLELAVSVGRLVCWSVTFLIRGFPLLPTRPRLRGSVYGLVIPWPYYSCLNALVTFNMAPDHPHATEVAVYPPCLDATSGKHYHL